MQKKNFLIVVNEIDTGTNIYWSLRVKRYFRGSECMLGRICLKSKLWQCEGPP